jgi:hypothetical protein
MYVLDFHTQNRETKHQDMDTDLNIRIQLFLFIASS